LTENKSAARISAEQQRALFRYSVDLYNVLFSGMLKAKTGKEVKMGWCPYCNVELQYHCDREVRVEWEVPPSGIIYKGYIQKIIAEWESCSQCFFEEVIDFKKDKKAFMLRTPVCLN